MLFMQHWGNVSPDLAGKLYMSEFGEKLISLRTARGLTAKEVCQLVHIPQSRLNELEWGVRIPTPGQIESLKTFFEIDSKALADLANSSNRWTVTARCTCPTHPSRRERFPGPANPGRKPATTAAHAFHRSSVNWGRTRWRYRRESSRPPAPLSAYR